MTKRLVAYVTAPSGQGADVAALRDHVKAKLPEHMVPAAFVRLESLPLSPNGKLDRLALPAPSGEAEGERHADPRTPAEETLARIWAQVLRVERVGVHDNFFELGGDSVLNIQITARANQAGVRVTPRQGFEHQTVAKLAAVAGSAKAAVFEQGVVTGQVPLTPIQHRFFDWGLPNPAHFNLPPERITQQSISNYARAILGNQVDIGSLFFLEMELAETTG